MDYEDRQKTLAEWGFKCDCSLCSSPDAVAMSDTNRKRIQQIVSMLSQPVFQNAGLMKQLGEEMEGIVQREELQAQLGEFYDMFARAYVRMGEVETGRRYAALAAENLAHFAGYDDERTERARGLLGELGKVGGT